VNKGDVLFLSRGQRNFAFAVMSDLENTIAPGYFFILRKKLDNILPEYLAWSINQAPAQRYLKNMARRGTHMPIIGKSEFGLMSVNIPDLTTQKTIVKLSELKKKEHFLLEQIQEKRSRLLQKVCLKAARREN
jgi:restriction endonuclease S subunit